MTLDDLPPHARPPKLRAAEVPRPLHRYIPLAERYGIGDDGYRIEVVDSLKPAQAEELLLFMEKCPEDLFRWLCGPASQVSPPSPEYVAFTCLVMAGDYAKAVFGGGDAV
jgi:hypothetical protein